MRAINWYILAWLWLGISVASKINSLAYCAWVFLIMALICIVLTFVQANRESKIIKEGFR